MTDPLPVACSLNASDLRRRLNEIAAIGAASLLERGEQGDRQLLRFRADAETRRRLEAVVVAETECCSFLELALAEQGGELVLAIGASGDGRTVAEQLAAAFGGGD